MPTWKRYVITNTKFCPFLNKSKRDIPTWNRKSTSSVPDWRRQRQCDRFSVTWMLDYFSPFGHLHQWKFAQKCKKSAKVGSQFCQIVNKPSKNCPRLWRFCQIWSHWWQWIKRISGFITATTDWLNGWHHTSLSLPLSFWPFFCLLLFLLILRLHYVQLSSNFYVCVINPSLYNILTHFGLFC